MDVTADSYWRVDGHDVGFFDEKLTCLVAQFTDFMFGNGATGAELRDGSGGQNVVSIMVALAWGTSDGEGVLVQVTHYGLARALRPSAAMHGRVIVEASRSKVTGED